MSLGLFGLETYVRRHLRWFEGWRDHGRGLYKILGKEIVARIDCPGCIDRREWGQSIAHCLTT